MYLVYLQPIVYALGVVGMFARKHSQGVTILVVKPANNTTGTQGYSGISMSLILSSKKEKRKEKVLGRVHLRVAASTLTALCLIIH